MSHHSRGLHSGFVVSKFGFSTGARYEWAHVSPRATPKRVCRHRDFSCAPAFLIQTFRVREQ